jgi:hypothetical protein
MVLMSCTLGYTLESSSMSSSAPAEPDAIFPMANVLTDRFGVPRVTVS